MDPTQNIHWEGAFHNNVDLFGVLLQYVFCTHVLNESERGVIVPNIHLGALRHYENIQNMDLSDLEEVCIHPLHPFQGASLMNNVIHNVQLY